MNLFNNIYPYYAFPIKWGWESKDFVSTLANPKRIINDYLAPFVSCQAVAIHPIAQPLMLFHFSNTDSIPKSNLFVSFSMKLIASIFILFESLIHLLFLDLFRLLGRLLQFSVAHFKAVKFAAFSLYTIFHLLHFIILHAKKIKSPV